eukprot:2172879-Prymnesium_polylepis.1
MHSPFPPPCIRRAPPSGVDESSTDLYKSSLGLDPSGRGCAAPPTATSHQPRISLAATSQQPRISLASASHQPRSNLALALHQPRINLASALHQPSFGLIRPHSASLDLIRPH